MIAGISPASTPWRHALRVAALFAVTGGCVRLRAGHGPVRERWLAVLRDYQATTAPWKRLPAGVAAERLIGGLDLTATLASGRKVLAPGLLAQCNDGVLVVAMAERIERLPTAVLCTALDTGTVVVERDGVSTRLASRVAVVLEDESVQDDEAPPAALLERTRFDLNLEGISPRGLEVPRLTGDDIARARAHYATMPVEREVIDALTAAAHSVGVESLRAVVMAVEVARALACLDGTGAIERHHAAAAAQLVLSHRARGLQPEPMPAPDAQAQDDGQAGATNDAHDIDHRDSGDNSPATRNPEDRLQTTVVEAARAAIPEGLLRDLTASMSTRALRGGGRVGARAPLGGHGRPTPPRAGRPGGGTRLAVMATLRAAAPWQRLRRRDADEDPGNDARPGLRVRADDLRVTRPQARQRTLTVFVVDASGSTAAQRLAEAKGAVELMLADCYARRDEVALIAFRGAAAELVLAPTRALARARRCLADLAGGGGSPLAAGLALSRDVVQRARRDDFGVSLVLLTDGRPNVDLAGRGGGERASQDALDVARALAALAVPVLLLDVAPRPREFTNVLARALRARLLALPNAGADAIAAATRANLGAVSGARARA